MRPNAAVAVHGHGDIKPDAVGRVRAVQFWLEGQHPVGHDRHRRQVDHEQVIAGEHRVTVTVERQGNPVEQQGAAPQTGVIECDGNDFFVLIDVTRIRYQGQGQRRILVGFQRRNINCGFFVSYVEAQGINLDIAVAIGDLKVERIDKTRAQRHLGLNVNPAIAVHRGRTVDYAGRRI